MDKDTNTDTGHGFLKNNDMDLATIWENKYKYKYTFFDY